MTHSDNTDSCPMGLTRSEIDQLKAHLENERRVSWLFAVLRIWAGWISGVFVAFYAIWDIIAKVIEKLR